MEYENRRQTFEEELMSKIAWYYYIDNLTQQQIAERVGIPRLRVIKLLEKARQTGVVQFKINTNNSHLSLEHRLAEQFGLKDVFIVPSASAPETRNESLAQAASVYISSRLPEDAFINIGYGDTTCRILNHLANNSGSHLSVVSLTGGVNYYLPNTFSSVFNAKLYLTPAPFVMSTEEMVRAVNAEPAIREIAEMVPLSAMSIVGIGGMDEDATIVHNGTLSQRELRYLKMQGAVGDVLCHFLDINGNQIDSPVEKRLISTSLRMLSEQDNVVGVAAGPNKIDAIIGALNGHFLNILITDRDTAEAILAKTGVKEETGGTGG